MKRINLNIARSLIIAIGFLATVGVNAKGIEVSGHFTNVTKPYIYLYRCFGTESYAIDSVKHQNGKFTFNEEELVRGFYKIGTSDNNNPVYLILGRENVKLTGDLSKPESIVITGSVENDLFLQYRKSNDSHSQEYKKLEQKAQQLGSQPGMTREKYEIEMAMLNQKADSLKQALNNNLKSIVDRKEDLMIVKVVKMYYMVDNLPQTEFFSAAEFSDPEYAYGDMLHNKVMLYFQKFSASSNTWRTTSNDLLNKIPNGTPNREAVLIALIRIFTQYDAEFVRDVADAYGKEFPQSRFLPGILKSLPKTGPRQGEQVPDLVLKDPNGKEIKLSSLRGKVVLIDFWASWCGPCRGENPNVVNAYNKYKDKGFTVYSVSLDTDKNKWMNAIKEDGLIWSNHVSDLQGWKSAAAAEYNVRAIPSAFLIDKDGRVIATNLRGASLEQKLEEILK